MNEYQFIDKKIESLQKGDQVRVLGTITDKEEEYFTLEDGTGQIKVKSSVKQLKNYEEGQIVRVFGIVEKEGTINSKLIQDMSGLNLNLYKRLNKILKKHKNLFKKRNV